MARTKGIAKGEGLKCKLIARNWGIPNAILAREFKHGCLENSCDRGKSGLVDCYGKDHHLALCDICGCPFRTRNGCDKCESHGFGINMLIRARFQDTGIIPEDEWRKYVRLMKRDATYAKEYPDLESNQASWKADLEAHILSRRAKYHDGSESKERKEKKNSTRVSKHDSEIANNQFQMAPKKRGPNPIKSAFVAAGTLPRIPEE